VEDSIETAEKLHRSNAPDDLHYRFIGTAKDRHFVVNVQFSSADGTTDEKLRPEEYNFMIGKVLGLILERVTESQNPELH